jgi:hypothetical protein
LSSLSNTSLKDLGSSKLLVLEVVSIFSSIALLYRDFQSCLLLTSSIVLSTTLSKLLLALLSIIEVEFASSLSELLGSSVILGLLTILALELEGL